MPSGITQWAGLGVTDAVFGDVNRGLGALRAFGGTLGRGSARACTEDRDRGHGLRGRMRRHGRGAGAGEAWIRDPGPVPAGTGRGRGTAEGVLCRCRFKARAAGRSRRPPPLSAARRGRAAPRAARCCGRGGRAAPRASPAGTERARSGHRGGEGAAGARPRQTKPRAPGPLRGRCFVSAALGGPGGGGVKGGSGQRGRARTAAWGHRGGSRGPAHPPPRPAPRTCSTAGPLLRGALGALEPPHAGSDPGTAERGAPSRGAAGAGRSIPAHRAAVPFHPPLPAGAAASLRRAGPGAHPRGRAGPSRPQRIPSARRRRGARQDGRAALEHPRSWELPRGCWRVGPVRDRLQELGIALDKMEGMEHKAEGQFCPGVAV